jgi:excisionase family DNA binding protein
MKSKISHSQPTSNLFFENQQLLSVKQLSGCLNVAEKTIRHWIHYRKIPFLKVGHLIRFDPQKISDWISERTNE